MTWIAHDALSEVRIALKHGGRTSPLLSGHLRALWAADALGWFVISEPGSVVRNLTDAGRKAALSDAKTAAEYLDRESAA